MKLTKRQLKRIIREEKQKLQESFWGPSDAMIKARNEEPDPSDWAARQARIRDEHDAESDQMEAENRKAFQQLKWSVQTLVDQLGHWDATQRVIKALMDSDGGPSADEVAETVHKMR